MAFKFRQLQYFVAVAEAGSISSAAGQLAVSQSTVTEAVKDLEADLGVALLERHGRGVALTHKGGLFLDHATRVLETVADARRALADGQDEATQSLQVGVSSLVAGYLFPELLARFRRACPGVAVSAVEDGRDELEHLLINGELDVALMVLRDGPVDPALRVEAIEAEPYHAWLPLGHPLLNQRRLALGDLAGERHVVLTLDEIEVTTQVLWRQHGMRQRAAFRTRSVEAVRSLVATGAGIAVLPMLLFRPWSLEGDRLEARPTVEPLPAVRVGVVWRRGTGLNHAARDFIGVARVGSSERRRHLSEKPISSF